MSPARAKMLETLWTRYQAALARGQKLSVDSLCAGYPELREAITARIQEQEKSLTQTATAEGPPSPPATQTLSFLEDDPLATLDAGSSSADGPWPQRIARFEVRSCLGEGAFGRVYQAHDPQLDRWVALKVAKLDRGDAGQRIKRFLREAKVAANLRHPHIIPLFEFGQDGQQFFIASAFINGQTLKDDLDQRQKAGQGADFRRAAQIVRRLAEALAHAHGQGIVHRDVKPANVMIDGQDQPLVMDFGLATRAEDEEKITHAGQVLGTPLYMSPEQAQGQEAAPACDQYSLGVMLYEMLTGQPPFKGAVEFVLTQHVQTEPTAPRQKCPTIPRDLETICLKALAKDPARRYADCQALADDLRRWLDGEPILAKKQGTFERLLRWVKREPKLAGSLALAAGLLIAVAVIAVINEEAQRELTTKADKARQAADLATEKAVKAQEQAETRRVEALKAQEQAEKRRVESLKESANLALLQANMYADKREGDRALLWIIRAVNKAQEANDSEMVRTCRTMVSHWATEAPELDLVFDNLGGPLHNVTHWPGQNRLGWLRQSPWFYYFCQDTRTGKLLWRYDSKDPEWRLVDPVLSPDGARIAGYKDNFVAMLDQKGQLVGAKMMHPAQARVLGFHPNGQSLLTRSSNNQGWLWNAATGSPLSGPFPLGISPKPIFSNDGQYILCWDAKEGVQLLDAASGKPKGSPIKLPERPSHWASSPDGQYLAAVFAKSVVRFRLKDGAKIGVELEGFNAPVSSLAFSPDNQMLALGFQDGSVWLTYPGFNNKPLRTPMRLAQAVNFVGFHADGKTLLASGIQDVRQWRIEPYLVRFTVWRDQADFTLVDDTGHVLYWFEKNQIRWQDLRDGKPPRVVQPSLPLSNPLAVDARQEVLVVDDMKKMATLCTIADGQCAAPVEHEGPVLLAGFNPQGTRAYSIGGSTLVIWDVAARKPLKPPLQMEGDIRTAGVSPDGKTLCIGFNDPVFPTTSATGRFLRLIDLDTGEPLGKRFLTPGGNPTAFLFDPAAPWLYVGDTRGYVGKLEARTGKRVSEFQAHGASILSMALSPDGQRLATGSLDASARIWNLTDSKPVGVAMLHPTRVNCLCFHPDGSTLVTGAEDAQARFWDAHSGRKLKLPRNHNARIKQIRYSQDGTRLLVYTETTTTKTLWQRTDLEALPINVASDLLPAWVAARTGLELAEDGNFQLLDRKAWLAAKGKLTKIK